MDAETREKIHKILDLVIDRNERGDATFFEFAGHTNEISVDMHAGAWIMDSPCMKMTSYIERPELELDLDEVIEALC